MTLFNRALGALLIWTMIIGLAAGAQAQENSNAESESYEELSAAEAEELIFEELIRDYILRHPEVIIESLTRYEERLAEEERQARQEALTALLPALQYDEDSPVMGNPDGDAAPTARTWFPLWNS